MAGPITHLGQRGAVFALLLVLALTIHQLVMLSPMHAHIMPMVFPPAAHANPAHATNTVPAHEQPVIDECPAPVAVLFDLGVLLFLFLLCLARTLTTLPTAITRRVAVVHWLWPPDRRRALLQVFLC